MTVAPPLPAPPGSDQIVVLRGIPWAQYDALCRSRTDTSGPRIAYLDGDLEIMSPGRRHETAKTILARLLEIFALENRVSLNGFGSETFRLIVSLGPPVLELEGVVVPEPGVVWETEGEDNVAPDLAIVFGPKPPKRSKLRRCPDVCVEVLSPGAENRKRDLEAKRELYWRRGAKEYWIVDPENECVLRVTRAKRAWREIRLSRRALLSTPLVPTWNGIRVAKLFEE